MNIRVLSLCLCMLATAACGEKSEQGHDHDHGPDEHADHADHGEHEHAGHDHDEHETADGHLDRVDEVTLSAEAIERWGVRVESATKRRITNTMRVPARVSFNLDAVAHVGSVVSGRVSRVHVKVGDQVREGAVLLTVASPELGQAQSDLLQKRAAVVTAQASLQVARTLYERAKALHEESQGIALSEVQQREAQWRGAEAEASATRGAATAAENLLHLLGMDQASIETLATSGEISPQHLVRAPIAGRVIEREATVGESVGPDRDALMVIADMRELWVIADVPETRISQVHVGAEAEVTAPAVRAKSQKGVVSSIATQLDVSTRSVPVRITVAGEAESLWPGMFVQVALALGGESDPLLAIPEAAVQQVEGQPCIFVPVSGEPNTFAKRAVRLGTSVDRYVQVLDGLAEGESFVAAGSFILKADLGKSGAAHEH